MAQIELELKVDGMTCQGCVRSVEKKLSGLAGVASAKVDLAAGRAKVVLESSEGAASPVDATRLIGAVEQIGFHASQI